jgi:branched-chain amino acid transport system substrate-binding protein
MKQLISVIALAAALNLSVAQAQDRSVAVKIGVLNDMSGVYSDTSGQGSVVAARMAVQDFGAAAKDMKVEIVSADHQNKPDVGSNIARTWIDVDKVDVIVDVPTSSVALAVNEIVRDKNKVLLISGAGTSDLTGPQCTPNTIHWTFDTWGQANSTGKAVVRTGGDTWFFITANYAFGLALERDTAAAVMQSGGMVLGQVRHPFPGNDFSSFLLQAQASKAKIIGLANAGDDTTNAIKQASEFGITPNQKLAALLFFIQNAHALGLQTAQGLTVAEPWYWDQSDSDRDFAKQFAPQFKGVYPNSVHAGVYSAVTHYLKAVDALRSAADGRAVVAKMKEMPTDDKLYGKGMVRIDGRKIHPMYLFEVKSPTESKGQWDYYKLRATIPAEEAFRPLSEGGCPLVRN